MSSQINVDGCFFEASIDYLSFGLGHQFKEMADLKKLSQFPNLRHASLATSSLDDFGLAYVCNVTTIEYLDLQDTEITDSGLENLSRLPNLKTLRLKGNRQLTNGCVMYLAKLSGVSDLQIHETSINQGGLPELTQMSQLKELCLSVHGGNFSFGTLTETSRRMPNCTILAKGHGEFFNGQFDGNWED